MQSRAGEMIELPTLFPHQEDLRDRTRASLAVHRRVILCAPPGMGKTRTAKWILGAAANRPGCGYSLFTVHRRGLVDNASSSFRESPELPHGIIMSGHETSWGRKTQVASIDTLLAWMIHDNQYTAHYTFDLIVWDEAHSNHPKFAKFLARHDARRAELGLEPAYVIGLTATPQAKGLSQVYGEIVLGPSTQWLIDNGFLAPFRYFAATKGRLDLLKKRSGEFTAGSLDEAFKGLAGDLVNDWKRLGEGRPTVGFFPRRSHAMEAVEVLAKHGARTAYVDGDTPDDERKAMFSALNLHEIDYIANVQVIERGTDIPRIGCVQLCLAIASITRYRQMIGRGSRKHPEKTDCVVIDHGGNVHRHGLFEDDPHWSLDQSQSEDEGIKAKPTIECPQCKAVYRGGRCRSCGYEPTPKERKSQGLDFVGGELVEFTKETASEKKQKSPEQLMTEALYKAGRSGRTWKQCVGIFRKLNERQGTNYRVPKSVSIAGRQYEMIRFGDENGARRVAALFPIVNGKHGGDYMIDHRVSEGVPFER